MGRIGKSADGGKGMDNKRTKQGREKLLANSQSKTKNQT